MCISDRSSIFSESVVNVLNSLPKSVSPVWAWEYCRISPPHFLAECRKKQLNRASFVLLCFVLFAWVVFSFYSVLFLICLLPHIFQHVLL